VSAFLVCISEVLGSDFSLQTLFVPAEAFAGFFPAVPILVSCISGINLLQDIPLDTAITETTDRGKPIVIALPNSSQVKKLILVRH
jgi:hypothetical protein